MVSLEITDKKLDSMLEELVTRPVESTTKSNPTLYLNNLVTTDVIYQYFSLLLSEGNHAGTILSRKEIIDFTGSYFTTSRIVLENMVAHAIRSFERKGVDFMQEKKGREKILHLPSKEELDDAYFSMWGKRKLRDNTIKTDSNVQRGTDSLMSINPKELVEIIKERFSKKEVMAKDIIKYYLFSLEDSGVASGTKIPVSGIYALTEYILPYCDRIENVHNAMNIAIMKLRKTYDIKTERKGYQWYIIFPNRETMKELKPVVLQVTFQNIIDNSPIDKSLEKILDELNSLDPNALCAINHIKINDSASLGASALYIYMSYLLKRGVAPGKRFFRDSFFSYFTQHYFASPASLNNFLMPKNLERAGLNIDPIKVGKKTMYALLSQEEIDEFYYSIHTIQKNERQGKTQNNNNIEPPKKYSGLSLITEPVYSLNESVPFYEDNPEIPVRLYERVHIIEEAILSSLEKGEKTRKELIYAIKPSIEDIGIIYFDNILNWLGKQEIIRSK